MAKKRKHAAFADPGQPLVDLVGTVDRVPVYPPGAVVLLVDRLDAHRQRWAAGTVIGPNVEGWPDDRVQLHLQHGYARQQGEG